MGHNGGFNPYRDANGEYATPEGAGKPGRNRKRGGGGGAAARRAGTAKGIQRATAVGQGIPNPGIDYRDRKGTRKPSEGAQIRAGEVKSSAAATLGRLGPMAMENEDRIARGLSPLKDARPRTRVRGAKSQPAPAAATPPSATRSAGTRRSATKGIQRATAVGQGIPNPGIDYRDRKGTRKPSEEAQIRAGEVKSSAAATLGRIGPMAMENEWRAERGLAPLKPAKPRTRVRQPK